MQWLAGALKLDLLGRQGKFKPSLNFESSYGPVP